MLETLPHNPEHEPRLYQPVSLELSEGDITTAMELFQDFLSLPQAERLKLVHLDEARARTGRSGYHEKGSAEGDDQKWLFHMSQDLAGRFDSRARKHMPGEARSFLDMSEEIFHSVMGSSQLLYQELEDEFPALVGMHFPADGTRRQHLRFLMYKGGEHQALARGHYDKGTGTIAIAESRDGLRLGYGEDDLTSLDRGQFDPVFFRGFGWHQLAEMLDVDTQHKAAWHDVQNTKPGPEMRWALVYFIDPAKIYLDSTKEQTHTPIEWASVDAPQSAYPGSFMGL